MHNANPAERISALQNKMREIGADVYLVPSADFHGSEYVGRYFAAREYITGFTGSAGTAVITMDGAYLFTDGRYFVQAEKELKGSGVKLMRMGEKDVPELSAFIIALLPDGGCLAFDGRTVSDGFTEKMKAALWAKHIKLVFKKDLVGDIWRDRPLLSHEKIYAPGEAVCGISASDKLLLIRQKMQKANASAHIVSALEDIAWTLNLRGSDIPYVPVFMAYLFITQDKALLFAEKAAITDAALAELSRAKVEIRPYDMAYEFAAGVRGHRVLLDPDTVNSALSGILAENNAIIRGKNPAALEKCVKNAAEIKLIKRTHVTDGVVLTKFIHWLKEDAVQEGADEFSAAQKLDDMRLAAGAISPSFETISAYGANAAMCHYSAEKDAAAKLEAKGLYLVDSGGHYPGATTDVTRTVAMGELSKEEKTNYTLVLAGMLRLAAVKFKRGCCGENLDIEARKSLWERGLDYNHGTGHGVGACLGVHEGPVSIRWRITEKSCQTPLAPGMVVSDEPGMYVEGKYGIRIENLILCEKYRETEYGEFLGFSFLTCVPIDTDALDMEILTAEDRALLNEYHANVFRTLSPHFDKKDRVWLERMTAPV